MQEFQIQSNINFFYVIIQREYIVKYHVRLHDRNISFIKKNLLFEMLNLTKEIPYRCNGDSSDYQDSATDFIELEWIMIIYTKLNSYNFDLMITNTYSFVKKFF